MLLSFWLIFYLFQSGVAYKSVAYKKSAYNVKDTAKLLETFDSIYKEMQVYSEIYQTFEIELSWKCLI